MGNYHIGGYIEDYNRVSDYSSDTLHSGYQGPYAFIEGNKEGPGKDEFLSADVQREASFAEMAPRKIRHHLSLGFRAQGFGLKPKTPKP